MGRHSESLRTLGSTLKMYLTGTDSISKSWENGKADSEIGGFWNFPTSKVFPYLLAYAIDKIPHPPYCPKDEDVSFRTPSSFLIDAGSFTESQEPLSSEELEQKVRDLQLQSYQSEMFRDPFGGPVNFW